MIKTGDTYQHSFSFSQEQVAAFAEVTGDNNPVHLDEAYAAQTSFKRPIVHGIFSASVFSKVFGTLFPGEGSIYLGQTLEFLRPMYVDTDYQASFTVKEINERRHTASIGCEIKDLQTGKVTLRGEAKVMHSEKIG